MTETIGIKETRTLVFENLTSAPTPEDGLMYYNSTDKNIKYYNNSAWKDL